MKIKARPEGRDDVWKADIISDDQWWDMKGLVMDDVRKYRRGAEYFRPKFDRPNQLLRASYCYLMAETEE